MQASETQAPSRKRPRPASAEFIQPKEEPEDEPASQRPRRGDANQQQGVLSVDVSSANAAQPSNVPSASAPGGTAVVPPEAQPAPNAGPGALTAPGANDQQDQQQDGGDGFPPNGIPASRSQEAGTLQGVADPDGASKDGGDAAMSEPAATPGEGLESSQRVEEHFQPSLPMQEMVVNFLLRMAFVIGGDRDHDLQVQFHHLPEFSCAAFVPPHLLVGSAAVPQAVVAANLPHCSIQYKLLDMSLHHFCCCRDCTCLINAGALDTHQGSATDSCRCKFAALLDPVQAAGHVSASLLLLS